MQLILLFFVNTFGLYPTTEVKCEGARQSCSFLLNFDRCRRQKYWCHKIPCCYFCSILHKRSIRRPDPHSESTLRQDNWRLTSLYHTPKCFADILTTLEKAKHQISFLLLIWFQLTLIFLVILLPLPYQLVTASRAHCVWYSECPAEKSQELCAILFRG